MSLRFADLTAGTKLPEQSFPLQRANLVRYAGASGDFNPIHWSQETAIAVGLPDVIAHGMLTMALAVRVVTDWVGDPGAVLDYSVRFTRPVVVATDAPTALAVTGVVRSTNEQDQTADIDLTASVAGETVLARARVRIRVAS
jgi:acyl dehydratase